MNNTPEEVSKTNKNNMGLTEQRGIYLLYAQSTGSVFFTESS